MTPQTFPRRALVAMPDTVHGVSRDILRDRACGAMLGLAIGDALGATVEFMTPREIGAQYGVHDRICGGGWLRLAPGDVTDDTTMTLALAGAWIDMQGMPDAEACALAFDGWMRSKPVDIGNTVRRGIIRWRLSGSAEAPPSSDAGNGATMRCLPVALACYGADPEFVTRAALMQARVTHNNPLTDAATLSVIEMVQTALAGSGADEIVACADRLVSAHADFDYRGRRCDNPSGYIVDTMRTVCQAMATQDGFKPVLVDIVNRGGDADTTGAIAGMVMGALCGEQALPREWLSALRPRVREACSRDASALIELSPAYRIP
ncbi:MAG: ADP-ribosyl-[dinitrogen reductase] hydrolase [Azoarcus sp.]|nr:ADP-ribosyl-[dinitrogen reductase] hydrolase [Azoarcus sp.]